MNKISLQYSIDKTGLPLIVTSSKPHLCFLIDTGATHNIMFTYVYKEISDIFTTIQETLSLMGIDGVSNEVHQVEAVIAFEDKDIKTSFSILDATRAVLQIQNENGIQIHGILGIPFLTQNKWILDFNNISVTC